MRLTNQKGENLSPQKMFGAARVVFKISLGIALIGVAFLLFNYVYILTTDSAEGTVVQVEYSVKVSSTRSSSGSYSYTERDVSLPTFLFQDKNGAGHTAPISSTSYHLYQMDDVYNIGYNPDDLSTVYVTDWQRNLYYPMFFFAIAGLVFWAGSSIRKTGREWEAEQGGA